MLVRSLRKFSSWSDKSSIACLCSKFLSSKSSRTRLLFLIHFLSMFTSRFRPGVSELFGRACQNSFPLFDLMCGKLVANYYISITVLLWRKTKEWQTWKRKMIMCCISSALMQILFSSIYHLVDKREIILWMIISSYRPIDFIVNF